MVAWARVSRIGVIAAALLVVTAGIAGADEQADVARARAEIEGVRFDAAKQILEEALSAGRLQSLDVAEAHRLLAEVSVALGDSAGAEDHFAAALSLNQEISLAEFASPKIVEAFDRARQRLGGQSLVVSHSLQRAERVLNLEVKSDPEGLVAAAVLSYRLPNGEEQTQTVAGNGPIVVPIPEGAEHGLALFAVDASGNRLVGFYLGDLVAEETSAVADPVASTEATAVETSGSGSNVLTRWWLWAGVSGALFVTGTTLGVLANQKQSDLDEIRDNSGEHFFSSAKEAEDSARARALGANISFALAGAAGVAAVAFYFLGRDTTAAVVPANDGASAAVRISF